VFSFARHFIAIDPRAGKTAHINREEQGETGYVIDDWYDGPRTGFANYLGTPHFYRSLHLDLEDYKNYASEEDRFELTPVLHQAVEWAAEDHQLWQKWAEARRAGTLATDGNNIRILSEDRVRHQELQSLIEQHLSQKKDQSFIAHGYFALNGKTVKWKNPM